MAKKGAVALLLVVVLYKLFSGPGRALDYGPGVVAPKQPLQITEDLPGPFDANGYRLTPLARFELEGRVLSTEAYDWDREAELAPVDIAFGWGPMSDSAVLEQIHISQGGRFYRWRVEEFPIPRPEIEHNSANMHLIPATDQVRDRIKGARVGEVAQLRGYLVRADAEDGWHWVSSLTRNDTGAGACELIWVESFESAAPLSHGG